MAEKLLEVKDLHMWFPAKHGLSGTFGEQKWIKAVDGVNFTINKGEIFGLIGESGSGKTTIGKTIMRLLEPTKGEILLHGENVAHIHRKDLKAYRRAVQMIFQDPYASMNPRFKIKDVMEEPLKVHQIGKSYKVDREPMIIDAMNEVKVSPPEEFLTRYPHMLSGGQRQRIATARGLILNPELMVADEPVSMVDLSTRAEILQMMKDVQRDKNLTYLYITHDLSTARYFTDKLAVLYLGRIMEIGTPDQIVDNPAHPYTQALLDAVCEPKSGKARVKKELKISGEIPSPMNIPSGCRFHTRCPYATDECINLKEPELVEVAPGHLQACRRFGEI